ncbi:MAG: class I SAM-dependent methyltransferase [Gammaproteobacteria bacterium]|nr:class I SAM-dependent methyltransferase [Gammaproteobacteria bacterium]
MDRWLATKLMDIVGNPPIGIKLWNDQQLIAPANCVATMHFHDRGALYKLLTNPDLHFGDLYSSARITVDGELVPFLETVYRAMDDVSKTGFASKLVNAWQKRPRPNSMSGSLDNIHHHYDLGNEFYEMWLDDEAMQYTCAYYPTPEATLEEAQVAKLHHVARKLQLKPGETVIEAGCGWGGLARFFAKHYGVKMRSYNISKEQLAYARDKAKQEGLDSQIEFIEDDYRNATGECDVFVSVGMLEHVGADHYRDLGQVVDRVLKPNGRGLIHSIGRNKPKLMNAWIEKRIFPGAYPPSLKEMMDIFEPNDLSVLDVENIRLHYARTLEHWLERYEENTDKISQHFDENFVRAWRLYLCGSIAAFTTGELQLFQIVFSRAQTNDVPWTRSHVYEQEGQS